MSFTAYTCEDFVEILSTKAPVPGAAVLLRWWGPLEQLLAIW